MGIAIIDEVQRVWIGRRRMSHHSAVLTSDLTLAANYANQEPTENKGKTLRLSLSIESLLVVFPDEVLLQQDFYQ